MRTAIGLIVWLACWPVAFYFWLEVEENTLDTATRGEAYFLIAIALVVTLLMAPVAVAGVVLWHFVLEPVVRFIYETFVEESQDA